MVGITHTYNVLGHRAFAVQVEADILAGEPKLTIVGLGDNAVKESRERMRSAITAGGFFFPVKTMVINLQPADLPKEGALLELAMAAAILVASGQVATEALTNTVLLGCLSLDGSVQPASGIIAAAIECRREGRSKRVIAPAACLSELRKIPGLTIYPIAHLRDLHVVLSGGFTPVQGEDCSFSAPPPAIDMREVEGMGSVKFALAAAVAGGHHLLMVGPPGVGKTMLARATEGILPDLSLEEALEITQLQSAAGMHREGIVSQRPFRAPHHTTSDVALVGGGSWPSPGEISLAHYGVLFLDELLEFRPGVLQALREPLEERRITISRAKGALSLPADFTLLAAANPCRCGYLWGGERDCSCPPGRADRQLQKIVGPFLDRISLEIDIWLLRKKDPQDQEYAGKDSAFWRSLVNRARQSMLQRNGGVLNGRLSGEKLNQILSQQLPQWQSLARTQAERTGCSYRGMQNSLRVALTIADLEGRQAVTAEDISRAFAYRFLSQHFQEPRHLAA